MQPFTTLTGVAIPLDGPNIDTDQIIPARFLRKPRSAGYHNWLFYDLRFEETADHQVRSRGFILDQPAYAGATILVAAENFGCGSSREGAVWAIAGSGIRAMIAPSFGDILFSNSLKNGFLPIVLPSGVVTAMRAQLHATPGTTLTIDLAAQRVTGPDGSTHSFEIDAFRKQCLLTGQDDLGITLGYALQIDAYEQAQRVDFPWLSARSAAR